MCGIAGFSIARRDTTTNPTTLMRALFRAIETRGAHASGAAWAEGDQVWFDKAPIPGATYGPMLSLPRDVNTAILHTRFATQGNPEDNRNNHPFPLPNITGVHNGVVDNDREVFDLLGVERTCQTDSEAIFALLAHGGFDHPTEALELVEGSAAVAWLRSDAAEDLHLARLGGRPLALSQTAEGTLVFASTPELLARACREAKVRTVRKLDYSAPEGTYLRVHRGIIHDVVQFTPIQSTWSRKYHGQAYGWSR